MENEILNIDFSSSNDGANWNYPNTSLVDTLDSKLVLQSGSATDTFTRDLGTVSPTNNRLRIACNIEVEGASNVTEIDVEFQILNNIGNTVFSGFATLGSLDIGGLYDYFLDRTFTYDANLTDIRLRIIVPTGYENLVKLKDLKVTDYEYDITNVRAYFSVDGLLEESQDSVTSAFQLTKYEIDGIETLTADFHNDNSTVGGDTSNSWYYCKADLDGRNRDSAGTPVNSFNPFIRDLGLEFSNDNYFGGKPTGTVSGNDYGAGVLNLGFEKPTILNGSLNEQSGAFFVDIDFSKDLLIEFNVLMNDNANIFSSPKVYRKYTIKWDSLRCEKSFSYVDELTKSTIDETNNGFLSGLTPFISSGIVVGCDESFSPSGGSGDFTYTMDFGTSTGTVGIEYNAYGVPDRFIISWNGQTFDTGYVGSSSHDATLISQGIDPADINTASPSNGAGTLTFNKDSAFPRTATIRVLGSSGTAWNVKGICASVEVPVDETPVDDVVQENWVKFNDTPTYNYVGNPITSPLGDFVSVEVLNELEYNIPLSGTDEININFNYDLEQNGDGVATIGYLKNGVETIIASIDENSASSQTSGSFVLNVKANEVVQIRRFGSFTQATSGSNGARIEVSGQALTQVTGNYSPFRLLNSGSILSVN